MSLVADYSSTSESDDASNDGVFQTIETPEKPKLPSANLLFNNSASGKSGEVFSNPYKQAEQAKIALLERHVKMVNSDEHLKEKNGKKICWNYRKGRCRFGSNCSFAHDSDLNDATIVTKNVNGLVNIEKNHNIPIKTNLGNVQRSQVGFETTNDSINTLNESLTTISTKKRNRPGLSETIVPNKRVLKAYSHQKQINNQSQNKHT